MASSEALDTLHQVMHMVTYPRIAMAIETTGKVGVCVHCCVFACCPGGRRGNTEQVVAQCQLPGASSVSLDMLHWAMPGALLPRICMAVTWPVVEAHLLVPAVFFVCCNPSLRSCYDRLK